MRRCRDWARATSHREEVPAVRRAGGQSACPGESDGGLRRATSTRRGAGACARMARQAGPVARMRRSSTTHSAGFVQTPLLLPCVLDSNMMHH
ncbi:Uncharacterized protein ToN1_16800 [Aromatoleum petrolei]|nr:Uncharacterized protein ToN1_16800 [Aromatoleum petrolei]